MLDTKRQRGWVIVAVIVGWLVLGAVWGVASGRAADRNFEDFSERAHAAFDGTDAESMEAVQADDVADNGVLTGFLAQAGEVTDYQYDTHTARYRLPSAFGRSETATVTWTGGGFTITRD